MIQMPDAIARWLQRVDETRLRGGFRGAALLPVWIVLAASLTSLGLDFVAPLPEELSAPRPPAPAWFGHASTMLFVAFLPVAWLLRAAGRGVWGAVFAAAAAMAGAVFGWNMEREIGAAIGFGAGFAAGWAMGRGAWWATESFARFWYSIGSDTRRRRADSSDSSLGR